MTVTGHYIGASLTLVAAFGIMAAVIHREWKHNSPYDSQANLAYIHFTEGLWVRCVYPSPGIIQCDTYDSSLLGLSTELHVRRTLMVLSEICAFTGFVIAILSLPCTTLQKKLLSGRIAGGFMIAAGVLCLIPVSMYAKLVADDFWDPAKSNNDIKYTFGPALYVAWFSAGISLLSGLLLALCANDVDENYTPFMEKMVYV